jgi:phosphohistidine swiveling domain-containing protein
MADLLADPTTSEFARNEEMKRRERKVLIVGELDEDTLSAIEKAVYGVTASGFIREAEV